MSIICAVKKDGIVAISSDTQSNLGSLKVSSNYIKNSEKLFSVNESIIGIAGWSAVSDLFEHLISKKPKMFNLENRMDIYSTFKKLHKKLVDDYYIEINEGEDQPVESSQLEALIINKHGLFEIGSYREVNEYNRYWAIGSGQELALGAMYSLYETEMTADSIAEAGVMAAAEFDDGCSLPLNTKVINLV